jgi:hypothetical protein
LIGDKAELFGLKMALLKEHGILEPHGSQEMNLLWYVGDGFKVGNVEEV